jgi:hypothetical protein
MVQFNKVYLPPLAVVRLADLVARQINAVR